MVGDREDVRREGGVTQNVILRWPRSGPRRMAAHAVAPIDLATNTVGDEFGVGALNSIAISPDGTTAFVDDWYRHNVSPIDLATHHVGAPIAVGRHPSAIAITHGARSRRPGTSPSLCAMAPPAGCASDLE